MYAKDKTRLLVLLFEELSKQTINVGWMSSNNRLRLTVPNQLTSYTVVGLLWFKF